MMNKETHQYKILIVDDSPENIDILGGILKSDYKRLVALNGKKAIQIATSDDPPDLILLDIIMPEMDGFQVLTHLKAEKSSRDIPVIVVSALDDMPSIVKGIQLGAEDFLPKPFDATLLKARISACLEKKRLRDREVFYLQQIEAEKKRSDELLHVILPTAIIEQLKSTNKVKPRYYEDVAILFSDVVDFTSYCDTHTPEEVVSNLQDLVEEFEKLALEYELQKIKTNGDAFMAVSGLLKVEDNPVLNCVECGLKMIAAAQNLRSKWKVRIGIHIGPVIGGIVGHRQYLFDIWGDSVNTANRIESLGLPNTVTLSKEAWAKVSGKYSGESLGSVQVKGKGELEVIQIK